MLEKAGVEAKTVFLTSIDQDLVHLLAWQSKKDIDALTLAVTQWLWE